VDRGQSAAFRTAVFPDLFLDEFADPVLPDMVQIVLHAHAVILTITGVHAVDALAGIPAAFKAECGVAFRSMVDACAFPEQIFASSISRPAADASASFQLIDMSKITAADGAVHPARRDQFL